MSDVLTQTASAALTSVLNITMKLLKSVLVMGAVTAQSAIEAAAPVVVSSTESAVRSGALALQSAIHAATPSVVSAAGIAIRAIANALESSLEAAAPAVASALQSLAVVLSRALASAARADGAAEQNSSHIVGAPLAEPPCTPVSCAVGTETTTQPRAETPATVTCMSQAVQTEQPIESRAWTSGSTGLCVCATAAGIGLYTLWRFYGNAGTGARPTRSCAVDEGDGMSASFSQVPSFRPSVYRLPGPAEGSATTHCVPAAEGNSNDRELSACVLCLERQPVAFFRRCKHLCLCRECVNMMARGEGIPSGSEVRLKCPVCRDEGELTVVYVP